LHKCIDNEEERERFLKGKISAKMLGKSKYIVQLEHLLKLGCQMGMD